MPVARIALVGTFNQRTVDAAATLTLNKDQRFLNCCFDVVQNPITQKATVYVEKRPGWGVDSLVAAGSASTGVIKTESFTASVQAFGTTNSTIYDGAVSVGVITGRALYFTETLITNVGHIMIKSSDGTGWYYVADSKDVLAYTADGNNSVNITDLKIAGVNSTAGLYPGQLLAAAANIVVGTRIVSVNSAAFTAVLDTATTGGIFADLAITKEPIAKITDVDFVTTGTIVTAFVEMDGWLFYANADGYIYNSGLNTVTAYAANDRINPGMAADPPNALARHKNVVVGLGTGSLEVFSNAGNSTGSPLQREPQFFSKTGVLDQRSLTTLKDDIYYAAGTKFGDISVQRLRNLNPQPISTPFINKALGGTTGGQIYLSGFQLGGYGYVAATALISTDTVELLLMESSEYLLLEDGGKIVLEGGAAAVATFGNMFVYNTELNIWSEWDSSLPTYIVGTGAGSTNQIFATSRVSTSGKVYTINPSSQGTLHTDDGVAYTMEVRTSKLDMGTEKRKFVPSIRLVADTQASGTATLEASDDDYLTWFTLGTFDMTVQDKRITRCGSYKGGRAYRLRHSANTAFRAEALEIDYTVGTS